MIFEESELFTVGAEWELQLLDAKSLDLTPGIGALMQSFPKHDHVKPEFIQSCIEVNTPVCRDSFEVESQLASVAREVLLQCQREDMLLAGAGTHPFCTRLALITPLPRYRELAKVHGHLAQTQLAFATHVHIGMGSGDEAIRAMRLLAPSLPVLIALAANSPFWRGHETGFASYRRRLLAASRSYGLPPYFPDWASFSQFFDMAQKARACRTIKDIHWDIRPHPDFGTLEFRVMDSQSTVQEVAFLSGVIRTLVAWVCSSTDKEVESVLPVHWSHWVDRENHFRASHWGMQADLIADRDGGTVSVADYVRAIVDATRDTGEQLGELTVMDQLASVCRRRRGYLAQLDTFCDGDARSVVRRLAERFTGSIEATP